MINKELQSIWSCTAKKTATDYSQTLKSFMVLFLFSICSYSKGQDTNRFYKTIDTLCSPYFYGRGYENDGHMKTFEYLKQAFSSADTVFGQVFPMTINQFKGKMTLKINDKTLLPCSEYIPASTSKGGKGKYKTLLLDTNIFNSPTVLAAFISQKIDKLVLIIPQKWEKKINANKSLSKKIYLEPAAILWLLPNNTIRIFSEKAWMQPSFQINEKALPANPTDCEFELTQEINTIYSKNIIARIKGTHPELPKIIISAHYDHMGGYDNCYIPGANDNASGVATMLEIFNYFRENPIPNTLEFIGFAGEEVGLVGSEFYTKVMKDSIKFVLNLDLIGAGSKGLTVVNATEFKPYFDIIKSINDSLKLTSQIKARGKAANSDHYHFSEKGIPAFFIYSNGDVGGYHNSFDTADKLEHGYFQDIFSLLTIFIQQISDNQKDAGH